MENILQNPYKCSFCLLLLLVSIFICAIKKKYIVLHIVNSMHNGELANRCCSKASFIVAEELEKYPIPVLIVWG